MNDYADEQSGICSGENPVTKLQFVDDAPAMASVLADDNSVSQIIETQNTIKKSDPAQYCTEIVKHCWRKAHQEAEARDNPEVTEWHLALAIAKYPEAYNRLVGFNSEIVKAAARRMIEELPERPSIEVLVSGNLLRAMTTATERRLSADPGSLASIQDVWSELTKDPQMQTALSGVGLIISAEDVARTISTELATKAEHVVRSISAELAINAEDVARTVSTQLSNFLAELTQREPHPTSATSGDRGRTIMTIIVTTACFGIIAGYALALIAGLPALVRNLAGIG
jgi:ATP-dependent Clp protease ATP-binding subunit ClpA